MFKRLLVILTCFIATSIGADLGVLFNSTNNNIVSPDNLVISTFYISTNLQLKYVTPSRALSIDSSSNVVSSTLTSTQQGYLAALTGGTNLVNLGLARLTSGAGNPTNGIMATNRTLYINTSSATINDSLWVNLDTNWFRIASTNGGAINESQLNFSNNTTADSSTNFHGLLKKLSGNPTQFMRGDGNWALPSNNLSNSLAGTRYVGTFDPDPSQQGYTFYNTSFKYDTTEGGTLYINNLRVADDNTIYLGSTVGSFIFGQAGNGSSIAVDDAQFYNMTDNVNGNVTTSHHGFAPKGDGNSAHFLNGIGGYSTPAGGIAGTITSTGSPVSGNVTYWSGATTITGTANYRFDPISQVLTVPVISVGSITASSITVPSGDPTGNLTYGNYVPTITASANSTITGTTQTSCRYTRLGNIVSITGKAQISRIAGGQYSFSMSLPIVTTLANPTQLSGTCVASPETSPATISSYGYAVGAITFESKALIYMSPDAGIGQLRNVTFNISYTVN